jgi:glycerol uptake facilitator-like aquaporin
MYATAEIIGTFVLVYIYLQTFHHPKSEHRMLAPLAVGLAYTGLLTAAGPSSGGSLNPARSLGPAAVSGEGDDLWIWVIGPIIGAPLPVLTLNAPSLKTQDSAQQVCFAGCLKLCRRKLFPFSEMIIVAT